MAAHLHLDTIEDYLGTPATRFFSAGYRRARHEVVDVRAAPADAQPAGVQARVTVRYPVDWSRKAGAMDIRPHLSSVDMIVLGVQLCEAHLTHAYGLDAPARCQMRLRKVTLRAGVSPQEELTELPAAAILRTTSPVSRDEGRFTSVYRCAVGVMRARFEIEHVIRERAAAPAAYDSLEELLGAAADRYYGDGFTLGRHAIGDVDVDMDALEARATARFGCAGPPPAAGIDGALQPCVTVVDCFVSCLQLVQVLLYELDRVTRQESETLWMLSTVLAPASEPAPASGSAIAARAAIVTKRLLELGGRAWRDVDVEGDCGGVGLRCSFAHRLPQATGRDAVPATAAL
jgi:hypothetical protein